MKIRIVIEIEQSDVDFACELKYPGYLLESVYSALEDEYPSTEVTWINSAEFAEAGKKEEGRDECVECGAWTLQPYPATNSDTADSICYGCGPGQVEINRLTRELAEAREENARLIKAVYERENWFECTVCKVLVPYAWPSTNHPEAEAVCWGCGPGAAEIKRLERELAEAREQVIYYQRLIACRPGQPR